MDEVLREQALRSMARRSRENATEKANEPKERSVDPQQQQRSYELKQRHQREVQRRDAIIHSHRTREWVNHLQESDNEEALERERVHINQQLAELDRQQNELNERANLLPPMRHRDQSRSPFNSLSMNAPSTNRMADRERHHETVSGSSANVNRSINDVHNRLGNRNQLSRASTSRSEDFGNMRSVAVLPRQSNVHDRIGTLSNCRCHFCGGNHKMLKCDRFLSLRRSEREQHVEMLQLCKNCFMPLERHRCRFGRCENCGVGKFHNSLLCPMRYPDTE